MEPHKLNPGEDTSKLEPWRIRKNENGETLVFTNTGNVVIRNPGIVVGYDIIHAVEVIQKHPTGPKISD
jgi:hypothetical protein